VACCSVAGLAVLARKAPSGCASEWEAVSGKGSRDGSRTALETDIETNAARPPNASNGQPMGSQSRSKPAEERIDDLRAAVAALSPSLEDRA